MGRYKERVGLFGAVTGAGGGGGGGIGIWWIGDEEAFCALGDAMW